MIMKNEYLITFKKDTHICPTMGKFKNFLGSHKQITFVDKDGKNHIIKFQSKEFEYTLLEQKLDGGAIGYQLMITAKDSDFEIFKELLRAIKNIVMELKNVKFITLHDDIAKYYCVQGYPIVYEIENLMRRLIYQIMNISKGYEWRNNTIPDEVKNSVKTTLKERNEDFLHNVDFIQLSNFLFKSYSEKSDLAAFLQQKDKSQDKNIALADLASYWPKSNWDRYFKDKVDVDGEHLKKCWEKLYDIRCAIAHCREITKDEFVQLQQMSQEVGEKLNNALGTIN
ncbi:MAG: HEPN domain-containing protein, partial [Conchiformibius sp.]|nr:HEPN domain-containing protein [Conchiformibius sp.]